MAVAPAIAVGEIDKETAAPNGFNQDDEPLEKRMSQVNFGPGAPQGRRPQDRIKGKVSFQNSTAQCQYTRTSRGMVNHNSIAAIISKSS